MSAHPGTAEIARQLACCVEGLDDRDERTQLALFRELAAGDPVAPARLADRVGLGEADVAARLGSWRGAHTDDDGRVVAFQGLTVVETPHRLHVGERTLYAWCAWDTLFLPELIGAPAAVESRCPTTGAAITLRVDQEGPREVSPEEAVISFILPGARFGDDTIASFCSFVHYLASPAAADGYTARNPGTFAISIDDAFEIGRRTNAAQWGRALAPRSDRSSA